MSADTLLVVLLVWAVLGILAAVAFGRVVQGSGYSPEDETLATSTGSIKYLRRDKRKLQTERPTKTQKQDSSKTHST